MDCCIMASRDYVRLFRSCLDASKHYEERFNILQSHNWLYYRDVEVDAHHDTLRELCRYLKHPERSAPIASNHSCHLARIADFLGGKPSEAVEAIQRQEIILLRNLIITLSSTKLFLLEDMSKYEFAELASPRNDEERRIVLELCMHKIKDIQNCYKHLLEEYERSSRKTKSDLRDMLVSKEYSKNKRLNKFEQGIDNQIQDMVLPSLDSEWDLHLHRLSDLQSTVRRKKISLQCWKGKIEMLRTTPQSSVEVHSCEDSVQHKTCHSPSASDCAAVNNTTPNLNDDFAAPGLQHDGPYSAPAKASVKIVEHETTDQHDASKLAHTFDLCNGSPQCTKEIQDSCHVPQSPDAKTDCSSSDIRYLKAHLDDIQNKDAENTFDLDTENATPSQNIKSQNNSTTCQYEYEHNKDHTPPSFYKVVDKEKCDKAFSGLDEYARTLFIRGSPS